MIVQALVDSEILLSESYSGSKSNQFVSINSASCLHPSCVRTAVGAFVCRFGDNDDGIYPVRNALAMRWQ